MRRICLAVCSLSLGLAGWAEVTNSRVAVVLSVQGQATYQKPNDIASRHSPLHGLDPITVGEKLLLAAHSKVTLSVLSTGRRFELTGPLNLTIASTTSFTPAPGITELKAQGGREGIVASQQIDLSKFGGASSRQHAFPVYVDGPDLTLDLDVLSDPFESSPLQVFYRVDKDFSPWIPVQASLVHPSASRDQLRLSTVNLEEDQTYLIYIGNQADPAGRRAQFRVVRLPATALSGLRQLEKSATDLAGQIELYQGYMRLRLFEKAEALLSRMQHEHPDGADWPARWTDLKAQRQLEPSST